MIKKLQHIAIGFLSAFYLLLSIGIEVDLHYCLGELKDIKLFNHQESAENCCSDISCSLERAFECCDNKHLCYHIDADQLTNKQTIKINDGTDHADIIFSDFQHFTNQDPIAQQEILNNSGDPPGSHPVYLLNCAFIFYG